MTAEPIDGARHGTLLGYHSDLCRCEACTAFARTYQAAWRERHKGQAKTHGNLSSYMNYSCRCDVCRAAMSSYARERYARRQRFLAALEGGANHS